MDSLKAKRYARLLTFCIKNVEKSKLNAGATIHKTGVHAVNGRMRMICRFNTHSTHTVKQRRENHLSNNINIPTPIPLLIAVISKVSLSNEQKKLFMEAISNRADIDCGEGLFFKWDNERKTYITKAHPKFMRHLN